MATVVWNAEARLVVTASSRVLTAMAPTQAAAIKVTLQNELHQPTADTPAALAPAMVQGVRSRCQSR